jgi:hypothetical protein
MTIKYITMFKSNFILETSGFDPKGKEDCAHVQGHTHK